MPDAPVPMNPVVRQIPGGQLRHLLTIAGTAAIAHGLATHDRMSTAVPVASDYIAGIIPAATRDDPSATATVRSC